MYYIKTEVLRCYVSLSYSSQGTAIDVVRTIEIAADL